MTGATSGAGASGSGVRRGDRAVDLGDPSREGESVLPRAGVPSLPGHRRQPVHPHGSRWAAAEFTEARPRAHGHGGAADDDHRPGRPAGARLLPLRHAAAEPPMPTRIASRPPTTCRRSAAEPVTLTTATEEWDADAFRRRVPGPHFDPGLAGSVLHSSADVVSSAPELARLTLNIAAIHHDSRVGGSRLVYGGHTIGLGACSGEPTVAQPGHRARLGVVRPHRTGPRG